jgi:hypothetical protein
MPAQYEGIKRSLAKKHPNYSEKELKKHAAMIYNSLHPDKPLIRWIQEHERKEGKNDGRRQKKSYDGNGAKES